jgi:uncharacterized protein YggE
MRHILLIVFLVIFCAVNSFAEPELKGTPSELENYLESIPKIVSLSGEASLEIQAKRGIVSVNVKTEDLYLQKALQTNQRIRNEIVSKLINNGIPKDNIIGSKFSSTPEFGLWSKKPNKYKVENSLKITVQSEEEFQSVANIIDSYEQVIYKGIKFKHDDKEVVKEKIVKLILDNLKAKQSIYENNLGIKLVPINFSEEIIKGDPPIMYKERRALKSRSYLEESSAPVSFGESKFYGSITIDYKVTR